VGTNPLALRKNLVLWRGLKDYFQHLILQNPLMAHSLDPDPFFILGGHDHMPQQPNLSATTSSFLNEMSSQLTRKSFCHSILWDCYVFLVLCCCIDHIFLQLASLCQDVSSLWFVRWTMTGMELLQSYCLADHLYSSHPRELTATQGSSFHFVVKTKDFDLDANGASHHANSADASTCSTEKGPQPWWLIRQPHLLEPQWLQQLLGLDAWNLIVQHENPAVPDTWTIDIWRCIPDQETG